ncbi:iron permease FTR1 family protein [Colletotrichum karsti]|uniref:Iron permease FTR1 family protein n=1 Tax=Colletotrichum karsti TaxID=1095194 RepID=A0A9P6HUD2_9PEZI|nr:iron permease FTR1 family protein [Colletotrichum karsti]KAF9870499.1 iron permease FTR1 family protein [Colletotrichum karsti]
MTVDVFSVPVFLVVFRESLETVIIVSVLLAFLKQTLDGPRRDVAVYKSLRRQVWLGTGIGFLICLVAAGALIGVFYKLGRNSWEAHELYYEGAFSIFAAVIITIMGAALLRIGKMQEKWRVKLAKAMESPVTGIKRGWFKHFVEKYAMFVLPFITVLREGIEAIVFVAGVSFSAPVTAVPLPVVMGLLVGALVGYLLYKGGSTAKLQVFLVVSTCLLYLVAAGLFTRAVSAFEQQAWNNVVGGDAGELGNGPGSYDIDKSVWHVNCCSPELNGGGGWGIFNAVLGWTNSATYGSVIAYNVYWIFVMLVFFVLRFHELRGHWPLMKRKVSREEGVVGSGSEVQSEGRLSDQASGKEKGLPTTKTVTASS